MTRPLPKVLVADDQPANITAVRRLLARQPVEVVEAVSGNAALARTLEHEFALILLDVSMPDVDGYEVAEILRQEETTRDTPIIFVTAAYKDSQHRERAYGAGAVDYIEKPIDPLVLRSKVAVFLDLYEHKRAQRELLQSLEERNRLLTIEITERQRREAELADVTERLARSNADLQQFAYAASHDLQAPLRLVIAYLQLLERHLSDRLDDEGREFMGFALEGARRLQHLIQDLLAFSRLETRARGIEAVDAGQALDTALNNLAMPIEESAASISRGPMPTVAADQVQLARLFQNLIDNAIKYRRTDHAPLVHVGAHRRGDEWEFTVADNGIGIAAENFDRVFAIFQRLHAETEYEGTGIGLAVCKRIVERHGGRIWLESTPGEGSAFHFTLQSVKTETVPGAAMEMVGAIMHDPLPETGADTDTGSADHGSLDHTGETPHHGQR